MCTKPPHTHRRQGLPSHPQASLTLETPQTLGLHNNNNNSNKTAHSSQQPLRAHIHRGRVGQNMRASCHGDGRKEGSEEGVRRIAINTAMEEVELPGGLRHTARLRVAGTEGVNRTCPPPLLGPGASHTERTFQSGHRRFSVRSGEGTMAGGGATLNCEARKVVPSFHA